MKPAPFQHHPDQVLADVVDVALDGQDEIGADRLGSGLGQDGAQQTETAFHRLGPDQHLRHKVLPLLKQRADFFQGRDQGVVQNLIGGQSHLQRLLRKGQHRFLFAIDYAIV